MPLGKNGDSLNFVELVPPGLSFTDRPYLVCAKSIMTRAPLSVMTA